MYLSAERLALANQAVQETFEQTSIAWQAIPHWDTRDPAQTLVPNGDPTTPNFLPLGSEPLPPFEVTLAEAISPTPDALLAKVMAATVTLAGLVDGAVFTALRKASPVASNVLLPDGQAASILNVLIAARAKVEKAGYRAPSCLITDVNGIKALSQLTGGGYSLKETFLDAGNVNSLNRIEQVADPADPADKAQGLYLGRRQRIAEGGAMDASPGEEPVDIAVSVPPSLEVIGDTPTNTVNLGIRFRFATRVKDVGGIVVIVGP